MHEDSLNQQEIWGQSDIWGQEIWEVFTLTPNITSFYSSPKYHKFLLWPQISAGSKFHGQKHPSHPLHRSCKLLAVRESDPEQSKPV